MQRSLLVQTLLDMATGSGGAKLEELAVDAAGTFDAGSGKGFNPVTVPSGSLSVLGEKGVVANHSVVVTPKAQVVGGWLNSGETSGSGVGVTASELVSGSETYTENGEYDVTNLRSVNVAVPTEEWITERTYTWDNNTTYTSATVTLFTPNLPSNCTKLRLTFEGSVAFVASDTFTIGMIHQYGVNVPAIIMQVGVPITGTFPVSQQIISNCYPNSYFESSSGVVKSYGRFPSAHENGNFYEALTSSPISARASRDNGVVVKAGSTLKVEYTTV